MDDVRVEGQKSKTMKYDAIVGGSDKGHGILGQLIAKEPVNKFILSHMLEYKTGGLIIMQYDEVRNELRRVGIHAYSCSVIRNKPYINNSQGGKANINSENLPVIVSKLSWTKTCWTSEDIFTSVIYERVKPILSLIATSHIQ
eukprot:9244487-Ditylum_brightwellii.AAC.1